MNDHHFMDDCIDNCDSRNCKEHFFGERPKSKIKFRKKRINKDRLNDSVEVTFESTIDTVGGMIIKKEIEIIKE